MINKDLLMEFFKDDDIKVVDKDFYIKSQMKSDVIKYITNLEQENEHLRTQVNTYENPDDYTLFYMWLDAKAKDKMKQIQEENERLKEENILLKENAEHNDKVVDKARWNEMIYKSRCEKAKEYIMSNLITERNIKYGGNVSGSDLPADAITPILDIIDGGDVE